MIVKRLVNEYNQEMEKKNKKELFNNKEKDIKEFDAEKRFIHKFISDEKLRRDAKIEKKKRQGRRLKSFQKTSIPIAAY